MPESHTIIDYGKLAERYLLICRRVTSFNIDNDLVQMVVERVIEENGWITSHWPQRKKIPSHDAVLWDQSCEAIDQALRSQLADLRVSRRYARLTEDRARIGIDECRAAIAQHDAESNLKLAAESKILADATTSDSRSLTKLQYLAMLALPLSLSSSIFGMGFFNTGPDSSGRPQLLVSSQWWWYLVLALPMTAFTVLSLYGIVAWDALRDRNRYGTLGAAGAEVKEKGAP
ncbi:MAG: hypothetical protein Q9220_002360 [cf. Caloplaca sp. 1 TL-2023]